jgi:SprT protein
MYDLMEKEVIEACRICIDLANAKYRLNISYHSVTFNLTTTSAGRSRANEIQFNRVLLEHNKEKFIDETVPHEVAHVVEFYLTGKMGHRKQWKEIMRVFGVPHCNRYHNYDTSVLCKPIRSVGTTKF